jgi:hypothetical protein
MIDLESNWNFHISNQAFSFQNLSFSGTVVFNAYSGSTTAIPEINNDHASPFPQSLTGRTEQWVCR